MPPTVILVYLLGLVSLLISCSSVPTKKEALLDPNAERLIALSDKLAAQEAKLDRLVRAVEAQKSNAGSRPARRKGSAAQQAVPPIKLKPSDPKATEEDEPVTSTSLESDISALSGETIADSTHEVMASYYRGVQMMEEGRHEEGLAAFREFLRSSPNHVYADRAQAWIAEAHFLNKEYGLVIVATNLLEGRYPQSFKLPEALYQRAISFENMGQRDSARNVLRNLLDRYPGATVATNATRKLAELSRASDETSDSARN